MAITHTYHVCIVTSRVFISWERKWIFCPWNVSVQSIALKLICLSGQSVYECHQPQNKNKCGLVKWSNITLLLVNNLYPGTAQTEDRDITKCWAPVPPSCPHSLDFQPSLQGWAQQGLSAHCLVWSCPQEQDTECGITASPEVVDAAAHTWDALVLGQRAPNQDRLSQVMWQSGVWQSVLSGQSPSLLHPFYLTNTSNTL